MKKLTNVYSENLTIPLYVGKQRTHVQLNVGKSMEVDYTEITGDVNIMCKKGRLSVEDIVTKVSEDTKKSTKEALTVSPQSSVKEGAPPAIEDAIVTEHRLEGRFKSKKSDIEKIETKKID